MVLAHLRPMRSTSVRVTSGILRLLLRIVPHFSTMDLFQHPDEYQILLFAVGSSNFDHRGAFALHQLGHFIPSSLRYRISI